MFPLFIIIIIFDDIILKHQGFLVRESWFVQLIICLLNFQEPQLISLDPFCYHIFMKWLEFFMNIGFIFFEGKI